MTPDLTINFTFGATGATLAQATTTADATTSTAPPPLALDQLQSSSSGLAPVPREPVELATLGSVSPTVTEGEPPRPMSIDQLQSTFASAPPAPAAFGTLEGVGATGPPAPLSLDQLEVGTAMPEPVDPETLGQPPTDLPGARERRRTRE